jgi:hypothetical protein
MLKSPTDILVQKLLHMAGFYHEILVMLPGSPCSLVQKLHMPGVAVVVTSRQSKRRQSFMQM